MRMPVNALSQSSLSEVIVSKFLRRRCSQDELGGAITVVMTLYLPEIFIVSTHHMQETRLTL